MKNIKYFPFILVFYEIAIYLSNDMYLPAIPDILQDLHLTMSQAQLTLTLWFVGAAIMPLGIGILCEKVGRRRVLIIGGVIYILSTILCAVTTRYSLMLVGRVIEGSMVASMIIPGYATVHELYNEKTAVRVLATMSSITIIAPALGPLLGSFILLFTSWRGIFWCIALFTLIPLVLLVRVMPEKSAILSATPPSLKNLLQQYARVISNKKFMLLMSALGLIFSGWIGWITAGPLLMMETYHYSAVQYGFVQAFIFFIYILGNQVVKYLLLRFSIHKMIALGMSCCTAAALWLLVCTHLTNSIFLFIAGMSLFAFGSALGFAPINRKIIETSEEAMGIRMALFSVLLTSYCVAGSAFISLYFNGHSSSLANMIAITMFLSLMHYLLYLRVSREKPALSSL